LKNSQKLILAVPKGRILEELMPLLKDCDIIPEDDFIDPKNRKLQFNTNHTNLDIIRVRAFDVATFVAYGGAHLGVVGSDAIEEFNYSEIYAPLDLKTGRCRLSVAMPTKEAKNQDPTKLSHVRVATKYPEITARHFAQRGIQTECIKLNGAMEIAPALGLALHIVDLISTGRTLKANDMVETEIILDVSSRLIVNRSIQKTCSKDITAWITAFRTAIKNQNN